MNLSIEIPYRTYLYKEVFFSILALLAVIIIVCNISKNFDESHKSSFLALTGAIITICGIVIAAFNFLSNLEAKIEENSKRNLTEMEKRKKNWIIVNTGKLYTINLYIIFIFSILGTLLGGISGFV